MTYRSQIAIIGGRGIDSEAQTLVENISKMLVEEGFRIVTGGLGALPSAAHRGAKSASNSTGSDTIAILPGFDPRPALDHADIIIPTGLDVSRNAIVANSDAVIAVGGGAGTLSEIAYAWQFKRPIIATSVKGWSSKIAGHVVDNRIRLNDPDIDDIVFSCNTVEEIRSKLVEVLPKFTKRHSGIPES
ncbi:MAG: acyl-CoA synthetase [Euryarchaeota archaeon]|nr:acyl-CoA synthetase [Euryarchaeota archaeon]|tara:strand:+ start:6215 stop:6778 length:564 start_codon:yes stop_codon:yes gene_type:complete